MNTMKPVFMEWLKTHWNPILRAAGFKGSGTTFRRVSGAFAHVINIQSRSDGSRCCVNLGVQPQLQPIRGFSEAPDFDKIKEWNCEIRHRLTPATSECDYWWSFGSSEQEARTNAASLIDVWNSRGEEFFRPYVQMPGPVAAATVADFESDRNNVFPTTKVLAVLLCARICLETKDFARAVGFSEYGIRICGGGWLDATFSDIIARCKGQIG